MDTVLDIAKQKTKDSSNHEKKSSEFAPAVLQTNDQDVIVHIDVLFSSAYCYYK